MQEFGEKSDDLAGVFNSCCVLGRAKCSVYEPKWVDYKLYWGMWEDGIIFVASLWTSGRTTAKWKLAFTKFDCMKGETVLPLWCRCRQGGS